MDLAGVLDGLPLTAVYQPVVHLETGEVLGYEALARGSQPPDLVLRAARDAGLCGDLDRACRTVALPGAGLDAALGSTLTLFVNVEPAVPRSTRSPSSSPPADVGRGGRYRSDDLGPWLSDQALHRLSGCAGDRDRTPVVA